MDSCNNIMGIYVGAPGAWIINTWATQMGMNGMEMEWTVKSWGFYWNSSANFAHKLPTKSPIQYIIMFYDRRHESTRTLSTICSQSEWSFCNDCCSGRGIRPESEPIVEMLIWWVIESSLGHCRQIERKNRSICLLTDLWWPSINTNFHNHSKSHLEYN